MPGLLLLLSAVLAAPAADAPRAPEVVVVSTLHTLHEEVEGYGYEALAALIVRLEPDVLAVELTPEALAARRDQRVKREYPRSVYPLLDAARFRTVALEPPEPLYSELVALNVSASKALAADAPERVAAFGLFVDALMAELRARWHTPADVNSAATDRLFALKHRYQDALFPPAQAEAWRRWNEHFLARVLEAAAECPGCRIVVLVGAEHGYWLRAALADRPGLRLADSERLLAR